MRRDAPLRKDGLVPVLLLRSLMRCRLETTPSTARGEQWVNAEESEMRVDVRVRFHTFLLGGNRKTRHDVQALGAVHHQWAGAALRLGGTGRSARTQTEKTTTIFKRFFLIKRTRVLHLSPPHLPLCPSALRSPLDKCLHPSPGDRIPLPSQRSSFSSLWLRSDDDKLWLEGVEVERCSVLLYTWSTQKKHPIFNHYFTSRLI